MKSSILLLLAVASLTASANAAHPMLGIWSGQAPYGTVELFFVELANDGTPSGFVCTHDGIETVVIDFGLPDHTTPTHVAGRSLVLPSNAKAHRLAFTPSGADDSEARFTATPPNGEPLTVPLTRRTKRECSAGVALRGVAPAPRADPATDTWLGNWPDGLGIELTIDRIDSDGTVRGLYCNLRPTVVSRYLPWNPPVI